MVPQTRRRGAVSAEAQKGATAGAVTAVKTPKLPEVYEKLEKVSSHERLSFFFFFFFLSPSSAVCACRSVGVVV